MVKNISSFNPLCVAFHEWISLFKDVFTSKISLKKRFDYLIKPPGWQHDDKGVISSDLRKEWEESNSKP